MAASAKVSEFCQHYLCQVPGLCFSSWVYAPFVALIASLVHCHPHWFLIAPYLMFIWCLFDDDDDLNSSCNISALEILYKSFYKF